MAPQPHPAPNLDGLKPSEADLYRDVRADLDEAHDHNRQDVADALDRIVMALEELAAYRRETPTPEGIGVLVAKRPLVNDIRGKLKQTMSHLSDRVIDFAPAGGDNDHGFARDVHALAAASHAYTVLGGDLELPDTVADASAFEAEVRVRALEDAVDAVFVAVHGLGAQGDLLADRASPLADLGAALVRLGAVR